MSTRDLISREIKRQSGTQRIRGLVLTDPQQKNFDPAGVALPTYVVDVDIGADQILRDCPIKINGPKARFYARSGSPVFLDRDGQGRYQVVAPGDRAPRQGNLILLTEATGIAASGGLIGNTVTREPYLYYEGTTPASFFDPDADAATLVWLKAYDRLSGLPSNLVVASDADGADITQLTDQSGNLNHAQQLGAGVHPLYRKFDATGGNTNLRSTADAQASNALLEFVANISETTGGQISIFAMVNKDATGAGNDLIVQTADWELYSRRTGGDTWGFSQSGTIEDSGAAITSNFTLVEMVATSFNDVNLYQDGVFLGNFTPAGTGHGNANSYLLNDAGLATAHSGRIAELLIMDETVSSAKRLLIESYFNQTMFVSFAKFSNSVDGYPKIRVLDSSGAEVSLP